MVDIALNLEGYTQIATSGDPVKIAEVPGVSIDNDKRTVPYMMYGSNDDADIIEAMEIHFPSTVGSGAYVHNYQNWSGLKNIGAKLWSANAEYTSLQISDEKPAEGNWSFNWELGTQNVRVMSAETTAVFPATGNDKDDYNGLLNVGDDGIPQGTDIFAKNTQFSIDYTLASSAATVLNFLLLADRQLDTNSATFLGIFPADTVLFLGASGKMALSQSSTINLRFVYSKNITSQTIQGITGVSKKGWEYMWPRYKKSITTNTPKLVVREVDALYVAKPYPDTSDLNDLLIS